jgi:hypothetical protein
MTPLPEYIEDLLAKTRWRQEINKRGYEGRAMASEQLTEALRAEIRKILDNDGKPFDIMAAQRVYDFAIAAKDMLTVSVRGVEDAIGVIAQNNGAMESLNNGEPPTPEQASETFGARMLRELLATLPKLMSKQSEDPITLVAAIAEARERGMSDLAARLEQRLMGTPLEMSKVTKTDVVDNSYEHGFIEGSMLANFEQETIDGHCGKNLLHASAAYREGFEAARARRQALDTTSNGAST